MERSADAKAVVKIQVEIQDPGFDLRERDLAKEERVAAGFGFGFGVVAREPRERRAKTARLNGDPRAASGSDPSIPAARSAADASAAVRRANHANADPSTLPKRPAGNALASVANTSPTASVHAATSQTTSSSSRDGDGDGGVFAAARAYA